MARCVPSTFPNTPQGKRKAKTRWFQRPGVIAAVITALATMSGALTHQCTASTLPPPNAPSTKQETHGPNSPAVTGVQGDVTITYGISEEEYGRLREKLAVTDAALKSFFKILEEQQVPPEDLDSKLRGFANTYKNWRKGINTLTSNNPTIVTLKQEASKALEAGDFARAENKTAQIVKATADALVKKSEKGHNWSSMNGNDISAGNNLVDEYNSLVRMLNRLFNTREYIKLLLIIDKEKVPKVDANKVKRLSEEISVYMTSFNESEALQQTANSLSNRGSEGHNWSSMNGNDVSAGNSLIWEYNYLVRRAKTLFRNDDSIQSFEEINEKIPPNVAAERVETWALAVAGALASL
jgi:hypothetical protein